MYLSLQKELRKDFKCLPVKICWASEKWLCHSAWFNPHTFYTYDNTSQLKPQVCALVSFNCQHANLESHGNHNGLSRPDWPVGFSVGLPWLSSVVGRPCQGPYTPAPPVPSFRTMMDGPLKLWVKMNPFAVGCFLFLLLGFLLFILLGGLLPNSK